MQRSVASQKRPRTPAAMGPSIQVAPTLVAESSPGFDQSTNAVVAATSAPPHAPAAAKSHPRTRSFSPSHAPGAGSMVSEQVRPAPSCSAPAIRNAAAPAPARAAATVVAAMAPPRRGAGACFGVELVDGGVGVAAEGGQGG